VAGAGDESTRGRLHVYTGDGKGKTTAALGLALRAAGAGMKVLFVQFAKGRHTSELAALERLADLITVRRFGREGFISGEPSDEDRALAREGLDEAERAASSGEYGLLVLDEAAVAVKLGLFAEDEVLEVIDAVQAASPRTEIVVTGREAPEGLIARANLVTEMRAVKHYFDKGAGARVGIEK
jgi:cob(I)alamin adenosyltransferase